jgi:putative membrane protein
MQQTLRHFLTGLSIGAANVIPGVSGGTIALLMGVYGRLLGAIGHLTDEPLRLVRARRWRQAWAAADGPFLAVLGAGMVVSIFTFARLFEWLLRTHEIETMAFFFGLILLSIFYVGQGVRHWRAGRLIALFAGAAVAAGVALLAPASENPDPVYVFVCGVIAVASMILPGLSGSFVLLMMGNYTLVLGAVGHLHWPVLVPMTLGCAVGLLGFSRLLDWVLKRWRDLTLALMTGFVLGSLAVIWPWKHKATAEITRADGSVKTVVTGFDWYLPDGSISTAIALGLMALGALSVWLLETRVGRKDDRREGGARGPEGAPQG